VAGAAAGARADVMSTTGLTTATPSDPGTTVLGFDTSKSFIGTTGITGDASALKITPVVGGTFLSPSYLSLGAFQAKALDPGQSVTFNNTPFHFQFSADSINGQTGISPNATATTPIDLGGVINGTLTGSNQSNVTATFGQFKNDGPFDPTQPFSDTFKFTTGLYTNTLQLPTNPVAVVPFSTNGGQSTARAYLTSASIGSPVPEPSTVVLFAATVVGLGFRHRLRTARAAAGN